MKMNTENAFKRRDIFEKRKRMRIAQCVKKKVKKTLNNTLKMRKRKKYD